MQPSFGHLTKHMKIKSDRDKAADMLARVAVVLVHPKYPENIGAAARAAVNMGLSRLIVVRDEEPDRERMLMMATHKAAHLIEKLERYENLAQALASFSFVLGTTAREGRKRRIESTPRVVIKDLIPLLTNNNIALVFGPEHRGLTNDDLKYCQMTVTIPTADFSSLNLAQAVAILCYELYDGVTRSPDSTRNLPRLAATRELEGMYEHLELLLNRIGFLRTADTTYWMRNIRRFLGRLELRAKEAKIIRGFCRQFLWHEENIRHPSPESEEDA